MDFALPRIRNVTNALRALRGFVYLDVLIPSIRPSNYLVVAAIQELVEHAHTDYC